MYPYAYVRNNRWVGEVTAQKGWSAFNRVGPAAEDFEDYRVLGAFCDEAERFIAQSVDDSDGGQPFFLYLALTSPHTPLCPSAEFEGKSRIGVYGDFVMETDHCVGRLLAALEQNGVDKNTLVIATSDHGAAPYAGRDRKATDGQLKELEKEGHYASGVFRGYKFSAYEGGFRVPFVARWPGVIRVGATCDQLIGLHDLMATLADISGYELAVDQAPDSISILPLLHKTKPVQPRRSMIFQATRGMAIRSGDWKLLFCPGAGCDDRWLIPDGHETAWKKAVTAHGKKLRRRAELLQPEFVQLFNLASDPSETTDLAAQHFDQVRELYDLYIEQVSRGRSTPGPTQTNDGGTIRAFLSVPSSVWETSPASR
jgi:arylsulfatase A-like enzyme